MENPAAADASFLKHGPTNTVLRLTEDQAAAILSEIVARNPDVQAVWPDLCRSGHSSAAKPFGQKLTTTIQRQYLREIVAGRKTVEYREIKPYWTQRLGSVGRPFLLRMINGMSPKAPEVTVLIDKVRKNSASGTYELHIAKVVEVKHWDARSERPGA